MGTKYTIVDTLVKYTNHRNGNPRIYSVLLYVIVQLCSQIKLDNYLKQINGVNVKISMLLNGLG